MAYNQSRSEVNEKRGKDVKILPAKGWSAYFTKPPVRCSVVSGDYCFASFLEKRLLMKAKERDDYHNFFCR